MRIALVLEFSWASPFLLEDHVRGQDHLAVLFQELIRFVTLIPKKATGHTFAVLKLLSVSGLICNTGTSQCPDVREIGLVAIPSLVRSHVESIMGTEQSEIADCLSNVRPELQT